MTEFPFERAAMNGSPMPEGLTGAEQILFQSLALLYARLREGQLDRAQAKREKAELIRRYNGNDIMERCWAQSYRKWSEMAGPMADYRKRPTLETANRVFSILYFGRDG